MGKKGYGSVFGEAQRTCYCYIEYLKRYYGKDFNTLVVDALDGIHVLPFARKGINVDCYEENKIFTNGGVIDGYNVIGLLEKIKTFNLGRYINLNEENFYKSNNNKKYDFVYVYRSLHLDRNKDINLDKKMKKIMSSVKENGFVYILYHLAENEYDYFHFPKNQYFRKSCINKMFDSTWEILDNHERNNLTIHKAHPFNNINHNHRVGYIFAKKKKYYKKKKYHYNLSTGFEYNM